MKNSWYDAETLAAEVSITSHERLLKLDKHGDTVHGVFVGEPHARMAHKSHDRFVSCTNNGCKLCRSGSKPSFRVAINFLQLPGRNLRIIEGGSQWFKDLVKWRKRKGLENWTYEIERLGGPEDPRSTYSLLPDQELSSDLKEYISQLRLYNLERVILANDNPKARGDQLLVIIGFSKLEALEKSPAQLGQ